MKHDIAVALKAFCLLTLLTGVLYPLLVTGAAELWFPAKAHGSLLPGAEGVIGSSLVGQGFGGERYFWPRPSAANYDLLPSAASNFGPTSAALRDSMAHRRERFITGNGLSADTEVPAEMLAASGSGADPHISPGSARMQAARIARSRGWNESQAAELLSLIDRAVEPPHFGLFGEPAINVLLLNLALDTLQSN
jgi:K+-transporting ATPase ATPase C chain